MSTAMSEMSLPRKRQPEEDEEEVSPWPSSALPGEQILQQAISAP
ncbi:MAG TPA: hypothetical protein VES60_09280 [Nakamurella sp.]|nr:hypothetical protein [Nakamurella sp.]